VRVVDLDNGRARRSSGEPGEMLIAGPQIMSGYFGTGRSRKSRMRTDEHGDTVAAHGRRRPL
jgi:non-ribosomal peptide synthetase component E (peptide arylation enzyme)